MRLWPCKIDLSPAVYYITDRFNAILLWWFLCYVLVLIFVMLIPYVWFHIFGYVWITDFLPIGNIAARSDYNMLSYYRHLISNLVFRITVFGVRVSS